LESQIILCFGKEIKTGYPKWAKVTWREENLSFDDNYIISEL
jgi:hypothetical protein